MYDGLNGVCMLTLVHQNGKEDDQAELRAARQAARADRDAVRRAVDHQTERGTQTVRGSVARTLVVVLRIGLGKHGHAILGDRGPVLCALLLAVLVVVRRVRRDVLDAGRVSGRSCGVGRTKGCEGEGLVVVQTRRWEEVAMAVAVASAATVAVLVRFNAAATA